MKNLKYFPFERNRYFYGKLLTVDDFETEQKYFNDKRRLINRFLHGCGVVCGMNVVRVDDGSISVEMGLALDFSGREIVIDAPVIKKLSMLEGFEERQEDAGYYYLCVEYRETEKEPVHSIAGAQNGADSQTEHNKYGEGYHLFLTDSEPENLAADAFYRDACTVYWGNGVRIRQSVPRFVRAGDAFDVEITVENMGQQQPFSFAYDLELRCVRCQGDRSLRITFDERDFQRSKRYGFTRRLEAMNVRDEEGILQMVPGSFSLYLGERAVTVDGGVKNTVGIVEDDARREVMRQYYRTAMEEIVRTTYRQSIYLAKIAVVRSGPVYVIDGIEQMPFRQYVLNSPLSAALNEIALEERPAAEPPASGEEPASRQLEAPTRTAGGTAVLDLGIGGTQGQRFVTPEIAHGLGLGPVTILLGQAYNDGDDSPLLFGPADVFQETQVLGVPGVSLAARADVVKGTFIIGAKLLETTAARKLRVNWLAVAGPRPQAPEDTGRRIFIKPDIAELEVRGSCHFEALVQNAADPRVRWRVAETEGGSVNQNGVYTAPNVPGVYEVVCESAAYPELRATAYIAVRETAVRA